MLTGRFDAALAMAGELHRFQLRKGTTVPYLAHLLGVCATVLEHGGGEDEAIAALLHDAVEDQGGPATHERIREAFGARVAHIVAGCTDAWESPKPPWRERKEAYLARLPDEDSSVLLVSAADKLYNMRSVIFGVFEVGDRVWDRFKADRATQMWYFRSVTAVFRATGRTPKALLAELELALTTLESLAVRPPAPEVTDGSGLCEP
jgi:(p)ppGpp synthase/HD superfamily hydrolase